MKVELNKNELAGALSALGKLVSRTSPVDAFRSVEIKGQNNTLTFRTSSADETICFCMGAEGIEEFTSLVLFDHFRNAVRGCRTKSLTLEWNGTFLVLDDTVMPGINDTLPAISEAPAHAQTVELPENFAELLVLAAPVVNRNDYRKVLQGINLSESGITATNGKELYHFPLALNLESTTIPFPLAFMATHVHATGTISMWRDESTQRFRITSGNWTWAGKALTGTYPNWRLVVPKPEDLTRSVTFTAERAEQMKSWLKSVPDDPPNNGIELRRNSDTLLLNNLKGLEIGITAYFTGEWDEHRLTVNRDLLLRLLSEGHTKLECQAEHGPFMATGGTGQYIAMPLVSPKHEIKIETKTIQTEEKKMNEITTVVPAVQVVEPNAEIERSPMEDLTVSIDAFKLKLKNILDESNALSRKVREATLAQKQKERDFIQAKRAIERIRMAI